MDRSGLKLGIVAGLIGISCCVGPTVLALLGLSSVSFAISLSNTLYYEYGWYFRGAAVVLGALGVIGLLRARKSCTLRGARPHLLKVGIEPAVGHVVRVAHPVTEPGPLAADVASLCQSLPPGRQRRPASARPKP